MVQGNETSPESLPQKEQWSCEPLRNDARKIRPA